MRVLVTGGAGFIGGNLVHTLLAAGHEPGIIDDFSTGSIANVHPAAWMRSLDITGPELGEAIAQFAPEAVVHLAAQVDVTASVTDPDRDRLVNVEGSRAVAAAARDAGATRFVTASSAAVYGPDAPIPTPEDAVKAPSNPYGEHKLASEGAVAEAFGGDDRQFAVLRFSNVFGPRQSWRGEGGVVAIFAHRMLTGQTPVVYGDGAQTRDLIYVGDVCDAIILALTRVTPLADRAGPDGPAYNISTGGRTTIEALAGMMAQMTGYEGSIDHAPARPADVPDSALDPTKARGAFGFSAHTELAAGLAQTVRWFAHQLNA